MKATKTIVTATLAAALALPACAQACSLPYVDDANVRTDGRANVTITCAGPEKRLALKITDARTKKRVKVHRHGKRVWLAVLKTHRAYKIQVRGGDGKYQTIRYRIG